MYFIRMVSDIVVVVEAVQPDVCNSSDEFVIFIDPQISRKNKRQSSARILLVTHDILCLGPLTKTLKSYKFVKNRINYT